VNGIGDDLAEKLAAVGSVPNRVAKNLAEFLTAYAERRKADAKGSTLTNLHTVRNDLVGFFGSDRARRSVTVEHAEEFETHMLTRTPKLAAATVARRLTTVRMLFKQAVRLKLIETNRFAEVAARSVLPTERKAYISPSDTEKVLAACDPMWRIIVALARYAGLRCPSEVLSVKWSDVNFATERMTVPSCKTEHLPGKAYRVVPIFAALKPYLDEAFELAETGAEYVVPGNLRDVANRPGG
jgi:integrase